MQGKHGGPSAHGHGAANETQHGEHEAPIMNNRKKQVKLIQSTGVGMANNYKNALNPDRTANDNAIFYANNLPEDAEAAVDDHVFTITHYTMVTSPMQE
jgi:hypothetical protein